MSPDCYKCDGRGHVAPKCPSAAEPGKQLSLLKLLINKVMWLSVLIEISKRRILQCLKITCSLSLSCFWEDSFMTCMRFACSLQMSIAHHLSLSYNKLLHLFANENLIIEHHFKHVTLYTKVLWNYSGTSIKRPPFKRSPSIKRPFFKVPNYFSVSKLQYSIPLINGQPLLSDQFSKSQEWPLNRGPTVGINRLCSAPLSNSF